VRAIAEADVERAIAALLRHLRHNEWFIGEHWPVNEPHVRSMIADVGACFRPGDAVRLLDVGCFNGYIAFLFAELGYRVTGADIYESDDARALFAAARMEFVPCNFNDARPFSRFARASFDVVILAQVIEHVLNHPLGLMRDLADVMRPGGMLILTTPNPATAMTAVRALSGRSLLWGTPEFIDRPKIDGGVVISAGEIHYREYTREELGRLLRATGFDVEGARYVGLGSSLSQSVVKRWLKRTPGVKRLTATRLLGSNHYVVARRGREAPLR